MFDTPAIARLNHRWLDFTVLLAASGLVAWILCDLVVPNLHPAWDLARHGSLEELRAALDPGGVYAQAMRGYRLVILVMVALICYGIGRARLSKGRLTSLSLVAAPACVLGMCLSGAQSLSGALVERADRGFAVLTSSQMDARQVWAALLWTRDQASMLPEWTRGGHEQWTLPGGSILDVDVSMDRVSIRHPGVSDMLACNRFSDALQDMRPPGASTATVMVDGKVKQKLPCLETGLRPFFIVAPLENRS